MDGCYLTVAAEAADEFVEKRSRFIGTIAPVTTETAALDFVSAMRARYRDATHTVYAYCLRTGQVKFSDDGEPQGTAGKPTLEVLQKECLTDTAVVVTRYYGGILLGTGGLLRAYTQGAKCAVDASAILRICPAARVELDVGYDFYGKLTYIMPDYGIVVESSDFGEGIRLVLRLRAEQLEPFSAALRELSGGMVAPLLLEYTFSHFDQ